ncbi:hypothetical protein GC257_17380 [Escherichia coli]|uniref:GT-D fold domain-containing protein n=1 Tax=Escherichia coli TaxID=562 RepID=UPI0017E7F2CF|nr:hypothetical protein [Escherichia coli]MDU1906533.1 hypothetical protein [Dysgonomonas sp.]MDU7097191.1 hypothetical protein [Enterobacter sp.]EFE7708563.1 hypothetical protein [Escherichia coli]EFH7751013.1 hypothetical protein [Escherichia coli]MBF8840827.1 hypothetical protein [Escherichia coli]
MELIITNNENELLHTKSLIRTKSEATTILISSGKTIINGNTIVFNNILELLTALEKLETSIERVCIVGVISNFSSETNIRTVIAGFIGLTNGKLSYIDETIKLKSRLAVLNRCFSAMNEEPTVEDSDNYTILKFESSSTKWSDFCIQETKDLISDKTILQDDFISIVSEHLKSKKPFSFIRINHCENRLLGYDFSFPKEEVDITYAIQFGENLSSKDTNYISSRIKEAVKNSTIIGVPKDSNFSSNKLRFLESTTKVHLYSLSLINKQLFTNVNIHYALGQELKFKTLLQSAEKIIAITCRDISILEKSINREIYKIQIPAEHRFKGDQITISPHYPDAFIRIEQEIEKHVSPGVIVLVGAGILGKIYCDTILQNGGIAIDVGSLMDAIENIPTRGDGFDQFKFWWSETN